MVEEHVISENASVYPQIFKMKPNTKQLTSLQAA